MVGVSEGIGAVSVVDVSADGMTLFVTHRPGDLDESSIEVTELPDRVSVAVRYRTPEYDGPTPGAMVATDPVRLASPLGDRPVLDAASGDRLRVWRRADIRTATYLPPGTAVTDAPADQWTVVAGGDGYHVLIRQDLVGAGERPEPVSIQGDESAVVGAARVRGLPVRVERHVNRSWHPGDPERRWVVLDWTEAGYRFRVSVSRRTVPYDQGALTRQAVQIATGLR
jgi:hypothetical protein